MVGLNVSASNRPTSTQSVLCYYYFFTVNIEFLFFKILLSKNILKAAIIWNIIHGQFRCINVSKRYFTKKKTILSKRDFKFQFFFNLKIKVKPTKPRAHTSRGVAMPNQNTSFVAAPLPGEQFIFTF